MNNTKLDVLEYLKNLHIEHDFQNVDQFSTGSIANGFHISRSLASQYLNDLYREGKIIKVDSRPVYYFSRSVFEYDFDVLLKTTTFSSVEDVKIYLSSQKEIKYSFENLIGFDGTLGETISQIKAAASYPSNSGLNYLLYGEEGTGKSLLSKCAYEYLEFHGSRNVKRVICDCLDQSFSKDFLNAIEAVKDGIVVIKRANLLYENDKRTIVGVLENRQFINTDNEKVFVNCSFVLLFDGTDIGSLGLITDYFPIKCFVPNFNERYSLEKENIIIRFFKEEAHILNKEIKVSYALMKYLTNNHYQHNLDDLKNIIQEICARANIEKDGDICVGVNHLPEHFAGIGNSFRNEKMELNQEWFSVSDYIQNDASEAITDLFDKMISEFRNNENYSSIIRNCSVMLDKFYDENIYDNNYKSEYTIPYTQNFGDVLNGVISPYNYVLPEHSNAIISYYCYIKKIVSSGINEWYKTVLPDLRKVTKQLGNEYPEIDSVIERICLAFSYYINVELDESVILVLYVMFLNYNTLNKNKTYIALVVCHGVSTAQSISNTVNSLVGLHVFEYVDMPLDKTMTDVAEYVDKYIKRFRIKSDVMLLVDMGSLEELGNNLKDIENNIYIMNNVSTPMALSVATKIIQNSSIQEIEDTCKEQFSCCFKSYENKRKEDAIVFISDNGKNMAEHIKDTFVESLPKHLDIQYFSCNGLDFQTSQNTKKIKEDYNVLLVLGASNFEGSEYEYISIENLVKENEISRITELLGAYLDHEEINQFRENLIYNFSLQSIIDNMSVLDAKKVLTYTKNTVNLLQKELHYSFSTDILSGIYIHVCFMVERLIKKEPIANEYANDEFYEKHEDFIKTTKRCFHGMCSHYGVELTNAEIKYLYEYIENDRRNRS